MSNESVFRAVADPTRRKIIDLLRGRELTPGAIAEALRIKHEALTFHLRVLLNTGLVSQRRRGRNRAYRLHPRVLSPIAQWLRVHDLRDDTNR
jgi:DNA-binding transcriptional ArsR family regulator